MNIAISISTDGLISVSGDNGKKIREHKGKSLIAFPNDYTVIDLETTGLDPRWCDIIELAAIKIRDDEPIDTFSSLINVGYDIDEFITELTGITNDMLKDAPRISSILPNFLEFIGNDIVVGHNVNFDINFIYDNAEKLSDYYFDNDYVDTMRLARRLLPELNHHRLFDLKEHFSIDVEESHRALADCISTLSIFKSLHDVALSKYGDIDTMIATFKPAHKSIDITAITTDKKDFDISHPFYGKLCVFTGALEKMKRVDAMQLVVNVGGSVADNITNKTNYLILGNNDFCKSIKDGKSNKQKKAESLKLSGHDIEIISEYTFYEMIEG